MPRRVFITVGEVSGDQHAGHLIEELRRLDPDIVVEGLGGPAMRAAGARVHFDTVARSAVGWKALLRALEVRRLLKWTRRHFSQGPPDLQICIDSWTMNWHFAKLARQQRVPVLYYIAPQVWASRPGRIKRLRRYVDRVACILPFEQEFFVRHGIDATFVGHPLFDALPADAARDPAAHFPHQPPVIGLLPGSRRSLVYENLPSLLDVAERIFARYPQALFVVPTVATTHEAVRTIVENHGGAVAADIAASQPLPDWAGGGDVQRRGRLVYGLDGFDQLVPRCDLCITVSGTATLHVAGHGVPMIVVYRLSRVIWHLVGRWVIKIRTYSLVNLLNDRREKIVPEYFPWYGSNAPVARKALEYLDTPRLLEEQRDRLGQLIRTLNKPGASRNAATLALEVMTSRAATIVDEDALE